MDTPQLLPRAFFARDALVLARALIGTTLIVRSPGGGVTTSRVVETEAYRGPKDLACHARAGITKRTRSLHGPPAHAYVFRIYGVHDCFNVVACAEGRGHAVLIRAVEPLSGLDPGVGTNGPGRLTRALGITRADDAIDVVSGDRFGFAARSRRPRIGVSARVGIAYAGVWADEPWRFFDVASAHVSRPPARAIGRPAPVD